MRWLSLFAVLLAGCSTPADLGVTSGEGPPAETPLPVDQALTVDGNVVHDAGEITGSCVTVYLWASTQRIEDWVQVAVNDDVVDGVDDQRFCDLGGHIGPQSYDVPFDQLPAGWYTVCNLGRGCTEPFEKR